MVPYVALASLALAAFATTLDNGFVWIDHWQIESGGLIARSWPELAQAVLQPLGSMEGWREAAPYTRPTVIVVLSLVNLLAGISAPAYHALCVGLHVANTALVYSLLGALGAVPVVAWFSAAIFAVHPLQTAAVSWISGIADPLGAFFLLVAWRFEVAGRRGGRRLRYYGAAALSFALALGAKETAAVLPLLIAAAYLCVPTNLRSEKRWSAALRSVWPFLLVLAAVFAYRCLVLSGAALGVQGPAFPLRVRLQTLSRLLVDYLLLPLRFAALTTCDDFRVSLTWTAEDTLATAALGALTLVVYWLRRHLRQLPFAVVCMTICLLPALNLVPILHYRADRFFYLPMMGWSLGVVATVHYVLARSPRLRRIGVALAVAATVALLVSTVRRNRLFHDDLTLFEQVVQVSPHCREAHTTLGDAYLHAGRSADAAAHYESALVGESDRASYVVLPKVLINLGLARLAQHRYQEAIAALRRAHDIEPQLANPVFGLGVAHMALGESAEGMRWLEQADALQANDPDIVLDLARAYDQAGRSAEAIDRYRQYLGLVIRGRAREAVAHRVQELSARP
ncbi:MAG: tetratricopeptide repeat protein [Deltaproteobacteria bacterium]|nr:tetratricopeptide repeat protein [Deltaproteobacteria bacterium]